MIRRSWPAAATSAGGSSVMASVGDGGGRSLVEKRDADAARGLVSPRTVFEGAGSRVVTCQQYEIQNDVKCGYDQAHCCVCASAEAGQVHDDEDGPGSRSQL